MDFDSLFMCFFVLLLVVVVVVVAAILTPCHGGLIDFNQGRFCAECGETRYVVCECGHELQGNYCTYCGIVNEIMGE